VDTSYYFVLEPDGKDDGPYRLHEIQRRVDVGLISRQASLCKTGDTSYVPLADPRFSEVLQAPRRAASGTAPVPVTPAAAPFEIDIDIEPAKPTQTLTPPPVAAMPPGFVPPVAAPVEESFKPIVPPVMAQGSAFVPPVQRVVPPPSFVPPVQRVVPPPAFVPPPPVAQFAPPAFVPPPPVAQLAPAFVSPPIAQFVPPPAFVPPMEQSSASQVQQFVPSQAYVQPLLPAPSAPDASDLTAETPMHLLSAEELGLDTHQTAGFTHAYAQPLVPAQFAQPPVAYAPPPPVAPIASAPPSTLHAKKKHLALAAGALGIAGAVGLGYAVLGGDDKGIAKDAIVRVTTSTGAGTGFLIQGPDRYAYVATAHHVIDRGERVLVERDVGADGHTYIEAYPETEVVATDPDADLAIIRIKNVDASRFAKLELATKPSKDEKILSYGYPGSSLARKPGLVSKDGKILSLVSFPAYDDRYARILRDNAVDGLLISTDIEQGMSGGPTLSASGKVVGINVTKDRAHVGQNGAVSVVALRELVAKIQPASKQTEPKTDDVVALLEKIETEYMLLPIDERAKVRETDFVHPGDLPNLRSLVNEVRREERNTDTSFIAKYQLSGQAALGMFFARLPGKLLETYRAPSTMTPLLACELRSERLTSFLGDLSQTATPKLMDNCDDLAVRPLAWDLAAATLQWDGNDKTYSVSKLEKMDEDGKIYRASVRISGASNLVELWLGVEQGKVRLKLFDTNNNLYAIKSPRSVPASSFQGTWSIKRPRVTDTLNKDAEVESSETLSISITDDRKVAIRNVVTEKYVTAASGRGGAFRCSGKRTIDTGLVQSFTGTLDNGVILAFPDKSAEEIGADAGYCKPSHKADRIVAIKLEGEQLTFYRTDGNAYPETVQLRKDVAAPAPAAPAPAQ